MMTELLFNQHLITLENKVTVFMNVASMWGTTIRDYDQAEKLLERFGSNNLQFIGVPCNQFGHQENGSGEDIYNILKYVRPGKGYV